MSDEVEGEASVIDALSQGIEDVRVVLGFVAAVKYLDGEGDVCIGLSSTGVHDWEALGMLKWSSGVVDRHLAGLGVDDDG